MTVRALARVADSYRTEKRHKHLFKKASMTFDERILSFKEDFGVASILTLGGRIKVSLISKWNLSELKLKGQVDLIFKNGKFLLCVVAEIPEVKPIDTVGILGVDLGIVNLATTSDGAFFSGASVDKTRIKINSLRGRLQKAGTKSSKRHLKKLSGRERRFKSDVNHCIAKQIVQTAQDTLRAIALEDLKGFKSTVRKEQRSKFGKWSFDELGRFISYKAQLRGIPVIFVDPAFTSQTCFECGHVSKSNRKGQEFKCASCGHTANADVNAALNISKAAVNRPIVASQFQTTSFRPELQAHDFSRG